MGLHERRDKFPGGKAGRLAPGKRLLAKEGNSLYADWQAPVWEDVDLTFIPYFAWANRGEGEMDVWVRVV